MTEQNKTKLNKSTCDDKPFQMNAIRLEMYDTLDKQKKLIPLISITLSHDILM